MHPSRPEHIQWAKVKCFKHYYECPVVWREESLDEDHHEKENVVQALEYDPCITSIEQLGSRRVVVDVSAYHPNFLEGSYMALSLTKNHRSVKVKVQEELWRSIQASPVSLRRLAKKALEQLSQEGRVIPLPAHLFLEKEEKSKPSKTKGHQIKP